MGVMKQDVLNFIEFIKMSKNKFPFDSQLVQSKKSDFVKIMTQEFGIVIHRKGCLYYIDPETAKEFNFSAPPLFGSEVHNISTWILSLPQNRGCKILKQQERKRLFDVGNCPEFTKCDQYLSKKRDKKSKKELMLMFGIYNSVSDLYKHGGEADILKYEREKFSFPYCSSHTSHTTI